MDKSEFTRRVTDMRDRLYRVTCGMLRERQDRLDAVQEAVLKAWAKRDASIPCGRGPARILSRWRPKRL